MIYEFINPSDKYTFEAKNKEVAALTVFAMGTAFGATTEDDNKDYYIPVFLIEGVEGAREWYLQEFSRTLEEGMAELKDYVIEALDSFVLGGFLDREIYFRAFIAFVKISDKEAWDLFKAAWDKKRTSMNNIGEYAHMLAEKLREE